MILNQKCESCTFANKCMAKAKLKVFSDEAKKDLGVTKVTTSKEDEEE